MNSLVRLIHIRRGYSHNEGTEKEADPHEKTMEAVHEKYD